LQIGLLKQIDRIVAIADWPQRSFGMLTGSR
jgi:hypothetical protein